MNIEIYKEPTTSKYKYKVVIHHDDKKKTVKFGASGYSDYTLHKTPKRKELYIARHRVRENWNKSGIYTRGFWSRWLLWNKPTIQSSIADIQKRFNVKIVKKNPLRIKCRKFP